MLMVLIILVIAVNGGLFLGTIAYAAWTNETGSGPGAGLGRKPFLRFASFACKGPVLFL